ncbi:NAD(P)-binding domain-containing protein [uncultured Shimia sp.]|uniref:NAD(P)-binding domain-containing protein n=1 Tax=uncultured Shimia sp. TaxID=573152 RepID=UPI00262BDBA9|nr:NAD(P)-binding domain-containing protein [uncultured Shimia sp.]
MRIGFIGLGTMGGAAALNLIRGGHQLAVCDLDPDRATASRAWADQMKNTWWPT